MRAGLLLLLFALSIEAEEWQELLARAHREEKPLVVFYTTPLCPRCDELQRVTVPHPTIERRLPNVVFAVLQGTEPGVAYFDHSGVLRARWPIVPDTTNFGIILDSIVTVAPHFARAVQLAASGAPYEADLEAGIGLALLERAADARAALTRAREHGSPATRQSAIVTTAVLDANEGKVKQALAALQQIAANPVTPKIAAEAWITIGKIHRSSGKTAEAIAAYTTAAEKAEAGSPAHAAAQQALAGLRAARPAKANAIRILPLGRQLVSGRQTVKTHVSSSAIARVVFTVDGRETARVERPPFSATLDFGDVPQRRAIRVVAFDRQGREAGRDERVVNDAGETFWLRLAAPAEGAVSGPVRVSMNVRAPAARPVRRVVVSWNDAVRAVLTAAPWETTIDVPAGQAGVLRAVAELDDGRSSEDAVLLNAGGAADRVDVQLVELPITVVSGNAPMPAITADRITVREGTRRRRVESIATAAETPLTVGLLIDVSESMQKTLPDLQEAAIRFLQAILGPRDRAFLVTFDTYARLQQPATGDLTLLRREIMKVRPNGLTALHDAMVLGLLQFEGIKGRRAMIVFSDGVDRTSRYGAADVAELARRVNVPIHVIASLPGLGPAFYTHGLPDPGTPWLDPADDELKGVARATGGTSHLLDDLAELPGVYARIEAALRAQILAFVRTEPATRENEWRRVQVEVKGDGLEVFAPAGYYAGW